MDIGHLNYLLSHLFIYLFIGLSYQGKDIMSRFIIEYCNLREFDPWVYMSIFI